MGKKYLRSVFAPVLGLMFATGAVLWGAFGLKSITAVAAPSTSGDIAYVTQTDTDIAVATFLTNRGYNVTVIPLSNVLTTDFSTFDLVVIGDDTGNLNQWGGTVADVAKITAPNKPIVGIGEGGYAFFGKLSLYIGWPRGWHGPNNLLLREPTAPATLFNLPNIVLPNPVAVFTQTSNTVGIYIGIAPPSNFVVLGRETPTTDHALMVQQGCRFLWGFSERPPSMTTDGQNLFHNLIDYALNSTCPAPPPIPIDSCIHVVKSSSPVNGTPVPLGASIQYTLTLFLSDNGACSNTTAVAVDRVPTGTIPLMGGLGGGVLAPDNAIEWSITPNSLLQTRSFTITVGVPACLSGFVVKNYAQFGISNSLAVYSNSLQHPITNCKAAISSLYLPVVRH